MFAVFQSALCIYLDMCFLLILFSCFFHFTCFCTCFSELEPLLKWTVPVKHAADAVRRASIIHTLHGCLLSTWCAGCFWRPYAREMRLAVWRGREGTQRERNTHWLPLARAPPFLGQELNLQPLRVPFGFAERCPASWATPVRADESGFVTDFVMRQGKRQAFKTFWLIWLFLDHFFPISYL